MIRFLKYSTASYEALKQNNQHNFAQRHSLNIYRSNSIYTFIPKNACSTMRTSIAYANGCIDNPQDFNWIHKNNQTFSASLRELIRADYTFVILRCPYARLASVYLDKFISKYPPAWIFYQLTDRKANLDNLSFTDFVNELQKKAVREGDIHWRSQVDFLVYQKYDDYFCLENFSQAIKTLTEKIGLKVIDARELTNHGVNNLTLIDNEDFSQAKPFDILKLKKEGNCPSPKSLYSPDIVAKVASLYREDIELYQQHFDESYLMF